MKAKETPYQQFENETEKQFNILLNEYKEKIEKSRTPLNAHNKFYNSLNKSYQQIQSDLDIYSRFIIEIADELDEDKAKNFEELFNEKLKILKVKNKASLLNQLAHLQATNNFILHLDSEVEKYKPKTENNKNEVLNIQWNKNNITEFTQLIYGLYEAGYLTNKENQITTLLSDVAKAFNVTLTKNPDGNLSKSIKEESINSTPEIFKKITTAYKLYAQRTYNKRNKK